ncbi:hypothetical protein AB3N62_15395 [Leptospira sp. WS4.C2]
MATKSLIDEFIWTKPKFDKLRTNPEELRLMQHALEKALAAKKWLIYIR